MWNTFVIFIQLNNMYVVTLMSLLFTLLSACASFCQSILPLCLLVLHVFSFVFLNVHLDTDVTSGLFRTSYLSITSKSQVTLLSQHLNVTPFFSLSSLSRFHALTSLQLSVLCNSTTLPGLNPSQLPRLWNFGAIFLCVRAYVKRKSINYVTSVCIITYVTILSTWMNAYHYFLVLSDRVSF